MTASEAELVKRTLSMAGVRVHSRSASSPWSAMGAGTAALKPPVAVRTMASTMAGWLWPWTSAV